MVLYSIGIIDDEFKIGKEEKVSYIKDMDLYPEPEPFQVIFTKSILLLI